MQGWCLALILHTTPAVMQVSCHAASLDLPSVNYLADPGEPPSMVADRPEAYLTCVQKFCIVTPVKSPTDAENAYFAGLFDGEGSVFVRVRDGNYMCLEVDLTNTHKGTLEWIVERYGGRIKQRAARKAHWKPYQRWRVVSNQHIAWIFWCIEPYMVTKRRHAQIALALWSTIGQLDKPGILEQREQLIAELKQLNKKGVDPPNRSEDNGNLSQPRAI